MKPSRESVQPTAQIPSYAEWEQALTRRYLMVGRDGDSSPLRSIEVTPRTLADAVGWSGSSDADVLDAFRSAVCTGAFVKAVERGVPPVSPSEGFPGYFACLAATVLVATLVDEDKGLGGAFRARLREFSRIDRNFNDLHGIERLWIRLVDWLSTAVDRGLPFRSLELPERPESWPHIGLTKRLAFPSKSDATLLRNVLAGEPGLLGDPRELIRALASKLQRGLGSYGMRQAFGSFRKAYDGGERFLDDHAFWRFAKSCTPGKTVDGAGATVSCTFDEDGAPLFSLVLPSGRTSGQGSLPLSGAIAEATAHGHDAHSERGFIAFRQIGHGRWLSVDSLDEAVGRILIGCSSRVLQRFVTKRAVFVPSGDWFMSREPMSPGAADALFGHPGAAASSADRITSVRVFGGIRSDGVWLGRPPFLPRVLAGEAPIIVEAGPTATGDMSVVRDEGFANLLHSDGPVGGPWTVRPSGSDVPWSRRLTFLPEARPHDPDVALGGTAAGYASVPEWAPGGYRPASTRGSPGGWHDESPAMADLLEAIYAGGRSGWDEADLVQLARDAFGTRADPWLVMRSLRDASVLLPKLRPAWRGRVWVPQALAMSRIGPDTAILVGTPCEALVREFRLACASQGVEPFRLQEAGTHAPTLIGCVGANLSAVADRLRLPIDHATWCEQRPGLALVHTELTTHGRYPASRWEWARRCFVADERVGEGAVALTRWTQAGCRDQDVYVVEAADQEWRFLSRAAAVLMANHLARIPLFAVEDGRLTALVPDAALPDQFASRLRTSHCANPGSREDGVYAYPVDRDDLRWLSSALPSLIAGLADRDDVGGADLVSTLRHTRGTRPTWAGSRLQADHRSHLVSKTLLHS